MAETFLDAGIDDKKRFEVLHEALKDAYKEIIDTNFKISGILLLVIAWFVSNKNPLGMLCQLRPLTYFALIFTIAGWLLLIYLFDLLFQRADDSYRMLIALQYDDKLYRRYRVTRPMFWCCVFGHFTMLLGVFTLILVRYLWLVDATCRF